MHPELRGQSKLSFIKPDQSIRDEFMKQMQLKSTLLDKEFSYYQQGLKYDINNKDITEQELIFKQELDNIAQQNHLKIQMLIDMKNNHLQIVRNEENDQKEKKPPKKLNNLKNNYTTKQLIEEHNKRSFFHQPIVEDEHHKKINLSNHDIKLDDDAQQHMHSNSIQGVHKNQQQVESLKSRISEITQNIQFAEQEAIYENSTCDQYKFKTKKYEVMIKEIRKKIQELHILISKAEIRYTNIISHQTLSQQQMQMAVNNLNQNRDQLKLLKETEEETLQFKQNIHDLEKQSLLADKKRTCELMMKIDYLSQQEQNQQQAIENLDLRKIFLYEQKQTSSYIEQNIDSLTKLRDIFIDKKLNIVDDDGLNRSNSQIGHSSFFLLRKKTQKAQTLFSKHLFHRPTSIEDIDSITNRSGSHSPILKSPNPNTTKKESFLLRLPSLQSERSRKIDKINKFCESDAEQLVDNLIQVYSEMIFQNRSLQSQFENLQKQIIELNLQLRSIDQSLLESDGNQQKIDIQQIIGLPQSQIPNQEYQQSEKLLIEIERIQEVKNDQDKIMLSSLYFLISTIKKHKHLIDEVNDKGEFEPVSDVDYDYLDRIDELLEKYSKGFMRKKFFESFTNRKKYQKNTSITSFHTHQSILIPHNPNNSTENIALQRDSFLSKERFFFFKELHSYFPLTSQEFKSTLKLIFPKNFNEEAVQFILDVSSKDIMNLFFLSKDDLIQIGEKCFNAYENFKQFNMILNHANQLKPFAKKNAAVPKAKIHGSRRMSQYSPQKNPLYLFQKDEKNGVKSLKDRVSFLNLLPVKVAESFSNFIIDKESSPIYNQNLSKEGDGGETAKGCKSNDTAKKISQTSIRQSQGSSKEDDFLDDLSQSMSISQISNTPRKENELKIIVPQIITYKKSKHTSPTASTIFNEELDDEEKEEKLNFIKKQEQFIIAEFMLIQLQKCSIKNLVAIIKEIIFSEKNIFKYITAQKYKLIKPNEELIKIKPEYLKFNENQIQSYINQAEKTLQYKKQREQILNDKLQKRTDEEFFDDENEFEEDDFENLNQWKSSMNAHLQPNDESQKQKNNFSEMFSPLNNINPIQKQGGRKQMYDSFINEDSQIFTQTEFFIKTVQKRPIKNIHQFDKDKKEQKNQEDLTKAKEKIIKLSDQIKKQQQLKDVTYQNQNENLKFRKLEQNNNNNQNEENQQKSSSQNKKAQNINKDKLKSILTSSQKENANSQIQVFKQQKKNNLNQEKEFIEEQRKVIKKDIPQTNDIKYSSQQNIQTNEIPPQTQKIIQSNQDNIHDQLKFQENQFKKSIEKEDNKLSELQNEDYYINNLKTFRSDLFFLQKLHILGKSNNIPFSKKNKSLELPNGLHQNKYFDKIQAYKKQLFTAMAQVSKDNNNKSSQKRESLIKQNNDVIKEQPEQTKQQHLSLQAKLIRSTYKQSSSVSKVDALIKDSLSRQPYSIQALQNQSDNNSILTSKNPSQQLISQTQINQIDILNTQKIEKENKIQDKVQLKIDSTLAQIKQKNMKSLHNLKQIFGVENEKEQGQSWSSTTQNSALGSKKNSGSFQSQFTNAFGCLIGSESPSGSSSTNQNFNYIYYPQKRDSILIGKKKNSQSMSNFVIGLKGQNENEIISEFKAMQKILPKQSPYTNLPQNQTNHITQSIQSKNSIKSSVSQQN